MSIHFTARSKVDADSERLEWFQMRLKEDFANTLRMYGKLPIARTEAGLEERKGLVDLIHLVENTDSWTTSQL